jgi:hypothetical protein
VEDSMKPYDVGYGKPPQRTQYRKGRSGNPKGRPKGTLNLATVLERTKREPVIIRVNGRPKKITKLQAAVTQVANKAATGDLKAVQLLAALVRYMEERATKAGFSSSVPEEVDERVVLGILERMGVANTEAEDDDNTDNE